MFSQNFFKKSWYKNFVNSTACNEAQCGKVPWNAITLKNFREINALVPFNLVKKLIWRKNVYFSVKTVTVFFKMTFPLFDDENLLPVFTIELKIYGKMTIFSSNQHHTKELISRKFWVWSCYKVLFHTFLHKLREIDIFTNKELD